MKKLTALLAALLLAASLTACGGENPENPSGDSTGDAVPGTALTYEVKLDTGVSVTVGAPASAVLPGLGEHLDLMEAPSCVHEGTDRVYTYDGYTVTTAPGADGVDYVTQLSLTSDAAAFDNGIMIGSAADDVTAAYGDKFEESFGVRTYTLGGVKLVFVLADGAVSELTVSAAE